jgi:peptidoglycan hydrolase-like protein with peptidoglycan-binding domain
MTSPLFFVLLDMIKAKRVFSTLCVGSTLLLTPLTQVQAKTSPPSSPSKSKKTSRKGSRKGKARASASRQSAPTADRYREIQEVLAKKGYLKSPPNGEWDAESQDAMRRFQADQKIEQTGKLNARSLIALGLGPTYATVNTPPATTPTAQ